MPEFKPITTQEEFDNAIKDRLERERRTAVAPFADYETIKNEEMLSRILPIEDEFCDEWFEEHKFTVGQVNEILMWWWKTADTSVTWDW